MYKDEHQPQMLQLFRQKSPIPAVCERGQRRISDFKSQIPDFKSKIANQCRQVPPVFCLLHSVFNSPAITVTHATTPEAAATVSIVPSFYRTPERMTTLHIIIFNNTLPKPPQIHEIARKSRLTFCYGSLYSTRCGLFYKSVLCG